MKNRYLFPQIQGIVHGGDYNPEQWLDRPDILEKDIELMKKAGMNSATLGVFSWTSYEPEEGEFHFEWLRERMDRLYENGIYTILSTPTAARPAWLDEKYPECMRVGKDGRREHHGVRENHCMSAPVFREKSSRIIEKLVDAVGNHKGLILWHVSNEFGGECYCPHCVKRFQKYLEKKFHGDIGELNYAWWTSFWSHTYQRFDQIEPPYDNGEFSVMGLLLEWKRFTTWSMNDYMKSEIEILKRLTPDIPVTTNFMQLYDGLDYREMVDSLDVVSWDSYPKFHNDYETFEETMRHSAFDHAVMRGMKRDKPFMLMESAPGYVNWTEFNKMKRPYVHSLFSIQALACGSDTVQYFQWRKSRGSFEQYHGAVVDHLGTDDTRIFKEVEKLGAQLGKLAPVAGSITKAKAAMVYDWDSRWAIADMKGMANETKKYDETCEKIYSQFVKLGVDMDVISQSMEFDAYQVLILPMMYVLKPGTAERIRAFVEKGGQVLATYLTGYVDENTLCYLGGFPGDGLSGVFGVISEELDTLYPKDHNEIVFTNGTRARVKEYAELLRVKDAKVLAVLQEDYYAGGAAVTVKEYGTGKAYYVGVRLDAGDMEKLFRKILSDASVPVLAKNQGVEIHTRENEDGEKFTFFLNLTDQEQEILDVKGFELLQEKKLEGNLILEAYGIAVVQEMLQSAG